MFSKYFDEVQKQLIKTYSKPAKKEEGAPAVKAPAKGKKAVKKDYALIVDFLNNVTAPEIEVCARKIVDQSGYAADSADFLACRKIYSGVSDIFADSMPSELVASAFHVVEEVNRKQLLDVLVRVANTKKADHFGEAGTDPLFIPSFIIALKTTYTLQELKQSIMEVYEQDEVDPMFEFEIMMVLGQGLIIKNWREGGRNFIALETSEDTLKWFFVLINEYVESRGKRELDLRQYVTEAKHYKEY